MTTSKKIINAYSCASPIRFPVIEALANGCSADYICPDPNPKYRLGDSVVWGLIRGAKEIMQATSQAGFSYYHVDNAYFGRNLFYRVTLNNLQVCNVPKKVIDNRYMVILNNLNKTIQPWNKSRNGPIVICPSSNFLHGFYASSLDKWINDTYVAIRKYTNRPIKVRYKEIMPKDDIEGDICNAWCVVTHVSAAALDALRIGIPVITTGKCAATPLSTPIEKIESPLFSDARHELFSYLAWSQFTVSEMNVWNIPKLVKDLKFEST